MEVKCSSALENFPVLFFEHISCCPCVFPFPVSRTTITQMVESWIDPLSFLSYFLFCLLNLFSHVLILLLKFFQCLYF